MYLKAFKINAFKYTNLILLIHFISASGLQRQAALKKTEVQLELLTDIDMLSMVQKGIRGGLCHTIYQVAEVNNKLMKDYDPDKESPYLMYWYLNNFGQWAISQKLPMNGFEWIKTRLSLLNILVM